YHEDKPFGIPKEQARGIAELIAETLNVYQESSHTPSELRELSEGFKESSLGKDKQIADLKGQVQQLMEALVKLVKYYDSPSHIDRNSAYLLAKQALKQTE